MSKFSNQTVIVTGGTRGIGRGISESFLKEGAVVIATYARNDEAAMNFKESMTIYGDKLILKKLFSLSTALNRCLLKSEWLTTPTLGFSALYASIIRYSSIDASLTNWSNWLERLLKH